MTSVNLHNELNTLVHIALSQLAEAVARQTEIRLDSPVLLPSGYGIVRLRIQGNKFSTYDLVADVVDCGEEPAESEWVEELQPRTLFNLVEALEKQGHDFTDGPDEE